jgi:hypothetical protein
MQQIRRGEMLGNSDFVSMHPKIICTDIDRTKGLTVHLLPISVAGSSEKWAALLFYTERNVRLLKRRLS